MPLPKSRMAYLDCEEIYNKASESVDAGGPGVRVRLGEWKDANYFRMRMNNARAIDRRDNEDSYEPGHPLYKASTWDALMVTIKKVDDEYYVYVEPHGVSLSNVEFIPTEPTEETVEKIVSETPEPPPPIGHVQRVMRR